MYAVKEIFKLDEKILLPTCMYYVKNINASSTNVSSESNDDRAVHLLEDRQEKILNQLEQLKRQLQAIRKANCADDEVNLDGLKEEVVIQANPKYPPYSTLVLLKWMGAKISVGAQSLVHSSVLEPDESLKHFFHPSFSQHKSKCNIFLRLIWTNAVDVDPLILINPIAQVGIKGEVNILRYLCNVVKLDASDACEATAIDAILDQVHGSIIHGSNKERQAAVKQFNARFGKHSWLAANVPTIADLAAWSALCQCNLIATAPPSIKKWVSAIEAF